MLTAGRYLVIITEGVFIFSFATRIYLDRKVTDLNSEIYQLEMRVSALQDVEQRTREVQFKIDNYNQLESHRNPAEVFPEIAKTVPNGINLDRLVVSGGRINLTGFARTQESFTTLVSNLQLSPMFSNITIPSLETTTDEKGRFAFTLSATAAVPSADAEETQ